MTIYVRQWGYVKKRFGSRVRGSLYCLLDSLENALEMCR